MQFDVLWMPHPRSMEDVASSTDGHVDDSAGSPLTA
jgi:hypothetical protein